MAVVNAEISGIFYSQTPVVNGCLFYSVFDHASHNGTGGGLECIYTPIILACEKVPSDRFKSVSVPPTLLFSLAICS